MPLLDGFWKYAQSDWPAPILSIPASTTKTADFEQLVKIGLVREGKRQRFMECPSCIDHSDEPLASELPDGTIHFLLVCPNCGGVEVTADDMRVWCIHFSELPGIMAAQLGMREPLVIVPDSLWKLGQYGDVGDIWLVRWLQYPEARDWLPKVPKTPQTILLYLGPPPNFSMLADMPQGNIIDASELISVDDAGVHLDMRLVDAALRQGATMSLAADARVFRKNGDHWQLAFEGKTVVVSHLIGMLYIHHLLEIAPKQMSVLQLRRVAVPEFQPQILGSAGELLDERALREFENSLSDISNELEEAKVNNDFGRQEHLLQEKMEIEDALSSGSGLSGRQRKASDDLERNRKTVSKAITKAIERITKTHKELGNHLNAHISCGDHCSYRLEPGKPWST
jgi:hypothetical protein